MRTSFRTNAFTLIEMLAATAITVTLVALLIPTVSKVRNQADSTKCLSNLRTLGVAINLHAADNDDRLPGPAGTGLGRAVANNQTVQLIYHLQPYLGLPTPTATPVYAEILHCPALRRGILGTQTNWYDVTAYAGYSNNDLPTDKRYLTDRTVIDDIGQSWPVGPWGRSNSTPAIPGWKRSWISSAIDETKTTPSGGKPTLASIPAIREIDATLKSWPWPVPSVAPHGAYHNVLFFDWHVERMPVTAYK
jgi:prepilin-type processing-associated H-X9-DG protein